MVFDQGATRAFNGWKSVNDRIITARLQSRHGNATIVQVYEPTEDADESDKDEFYNHLEDTCDSLPSHGAKILMGQQTRKHQDLFDDNGEEMLNKKQHAYRALQRNGRSAAKKAAYNAIKNRVHAGLLAKLQG
ncbi:Hypp9609 [Branchiostoma lanceolatum]|uniref:Hypp9609 protein n=1 Tax=Branchiostoma lanceolatum TaxID=7740 RepID=A0A8S4MNQ4_BRALA|nr:Hypp9609 [Branchiostoma lanceolatum]